MIHVLDVPGWRPAWLNEISRVHWRVGHRLKSADAAVVLAAANEAGTPKATGRRRVGLTVYLKKRGKEPDPDNVWKSLLDALKRAGGLIIDDSRKWCEKSDPVFVPWARHRGDVRTVLTLEDLT